MVGSVASGSFNLWALLLNFVVFSNQFHFPFPFGCATILMRNCSHLMKDDALDFCSVHLLGVFLRILRPLCSGGLLSALSTARSEGETGIAWLYSVSLAPLLGEVSFSRMLPAPPS